MRSLRAKYTLTLLLTSLAAVALVGIIARAVLMQKFNQIVMKESFTRFQGDVTAYVGKYGSWDKAERAEPFGAFMRQRQAKMGPPPYAAVGLGTSPIRAEAPMADAPPPPNAPAVPDAGGPPPPNGDEHANPSDADPRHQPPFRFLLLRPDGRVLLGPDSYVKGTVAAPGLRAQAMPIKVDDQVAALAVPLDEPNLNPLDQGYMTAMQHALWCGVAGAALLATLLGLFFGSRWGRKLDEVTRAIQAMADGELHQEVAVHSDDEIGVLTGAFNRMSAELAQAYEDLERSHATIQEQATQLKELSVRDELTGLYNRRHFGEQAAAAYAQAGRYSHPLTLMIGDIDHFKQINDRFSHAVGDQVLRMIAKLLQGNTRQTDVVARYGGEEFVIAFTQTPLPQAVALCEKLRLLIEAHPWHEIHPELQVTMSMGLNDDLGRGSYDAMLAAADAHLYAAKATGRNRVCADAPATTSSVSENLVGPGDVPPHLPDEGLQAGKLALVA